MHPVVKKKI